MSGQLSYPIAQPQWLPGQRTKATDAGSRSFINPLLPQISTLTVGGTATAGAYSVTFSQPADPSFTPITFTFTRVGETNAQIATGLHNLITASSPYTTDSLKMLGILTSVDGGAGVLTFTFKSTGIVWLITTSAPSPGTLTAANTQTAGGSNVRVGGFVRHTAAASAANILVPFTTATTTAELPGVAVRTYNLVNDPTLAYDIYPPGQCVPVDQNSIVAMQVWEAVTEFDTPAVWIDPSDATAFPGQVGKTVTGGKSVAAPTGTKFLGRASAGGFVEVQLAHGAGA